MNHDHPRASAETEPSGSGARGRRQAGWGFAIGAVAIQAIYLTVNGVFWPTGYGVVVDLVWVLLLVGLAFSVASGLLWVLVRLVRPFPIGSVCWTLGTLSAATAVSIVGLQCPPRFTLVTVLGLALMAGTMGAGLASLRTAAEPHRRRWVAPGAVSLAAIAFASLAVWLIRPGQDPWMDLQRPVPVAGVAPLSLPDPSAPGKLTAKTLSYGTGTHRHWPDFAAGAVLRTQPADASRLLETSGALKTRFWQWRWGIKDRQLPLNGTVWHPDGPGPYPLVLCVHGNHQAMDRSDTGYAYLGKLLASRGFIFVSVDENFLNSDWGEFRWGENAVRGWLLLKHLEVWRRWNRETDNPFFGRVDLDRIALIGHSRGGEAAGHAVTMNRLSHWPEDANERFDFGFNIRGVIALAPSDGQFEPCGVPNPIENVDYLVIQGGHDADVAPFVGQRAFRRVRFTDGRPHFKASWWVHRANHGQFNTTWGNNDMGDATGWLLQRGSLLPAVEQRRLACVAVSAFLECSLKDRREYAALFRHPSSGAAWLPAGILLSQFEDESFQPLATFEEDIDVTTTTVPEGHVEAEHLTVWREYRVKGRWDFDFQHRGVWLGWEQATNRLSPATFGLALPPGAVAGIPLTDHSRLVLTLADTDEEPSKPSGSNGAESTASHASPAREASRPKPPIDFTVELTDSDGRLAALPLSSRQPLQAVVKTRRHKWGFFEDLIYKTSWEPTFQTIELPFTNFREANPNLDLRRLRSLRLRFDQTERGVIILDQIGVANGP